MKILSEQIIKNIIIITDKDSPHILRWRKGLSNLGYSVYVLFLNVDNDFNITDFIESNFDKKSSVLLIGPGEKVNMLNFKDFTVFFLSFGYDLQLYLPQLRTFIQKLKSRVNAGIIVDSSYNKKILLRQNFPENKIVEIPWGVESSWVNSNYKKKFRSSNATFISLRNHETLYRVNNTIYFFNLLFRRGLVNKLILAGSGTQTTNLLSTIKHLGVERHVEVLGRVDEKQLREYLEESDFYLSTSCVDGTSVSMLQSMAVGVIPIVSDNSTNSQWVEHMKTGLILDNIDWMSNVNNFISLLQLDLEYISDRNIRIILEKCNFEKNLMSVVFFLTKIHNSTD